MKYLIILICLSLTLPVFAKRFGGFRRSRSTFSRSKRKTYKPRRAKSAKKATKKAATTKPNNYKYRKPMVTRVIPSERRSTGFSGTSMLMGVGLGYLLFNSSGERIDQTECDRLGDKCVKEDKLKPVSGDY